MLKQFFSYIPTDLPEVPKEEPPDPNADRALSESFRTSRRSLIALCAVCIAWSTAQFSIDELTIDAAGFKVDLKNASVPLLLGVGLAYLAARWMIEFAMMPRHVRRWPLAQLDFRIVSVVTRFSILALTAGALNRSLWSVTAVVISICSLALVSCILTIILMFITTPIRMWARERADRLSAANAVGEGLAWAVFFAVVLVVIGTICISVASYRYEPWRVAIWPTPPNPIAFSIFVLTLIVTFLSHWLLQPVTNKLFAERSPYFTERKSDGALVVTFVNQKKEPLL